VLAAFREAGFAQAAEIGTLRQGGAGVSFAA
jgi:hypothetical protein